MVGFSTEKATLSCCRFLSTLTESERQPRRENRGTPVYEATAAALAVVNYSVILQNTYSLIMGELRISKDLH